MIQNYGIVSQGQEAGPDIVLNHIDTIADGSAGASMTFTFEAANSGSEVAETVYWEIYDVEDTLVDSGNEEFQITSGTDTYAFTGITYPASEGTYHATVHLTDQTPVESNEFDVTAT